MLAEKKGVEFLSLIVLVLGAKQDVRARGRLYQRRGGDHAQMRDVLAVTSRTTTISPSRYETKGADVAEKSEGVTFVADIFDITPLAGRQNMEISLPNSSLPCQPSRDCLFVRGPGEEKRWGEKEPLRETLFDVVGK